MSALLANLGLHLVGPRVMLGVLVAAAIALAVALWDLDRVRNKAHDAQNALDDAASTIADQQAEIKQINDLLDVKRAQVRQSHARLDAAAERLKALEESDADAKTWADRPVPDGIRHWLHNPDGRQ
ncbi:hypothetical protein V6X64_02430 [Spiribacter sp. 227]|uniref:DUF2570 domain-containing protein n=2 Tax=Spiribacter onubensis TaxID=3122420 RepID=A0ABV3S6U7_9GAMM